MSARCIGEPVSWLRLERFHLGDVQEPDRAAITEHLAACPACAACLAHIEEDDARALPPLTVTKPARRKVLSLSPLRAAAALGALAAAAALVLVLRGGARPVELAPTSTGGSRVKGDAMAFTLVRDDEERFAGTTGVYRDGDRFKVVVTCPVGAGMAFDVVVYDADGASFPLKAAGQLACANEAPLPGAFRLTGNAEETVCLVWSVGDAVDRASLANRTGIEGHSLCKQLSPAPKPRP